MKNSSLKNIFLLFLLISSSNIIAQKSNLKYIQKELNDVNSNVILVAAHRGAHIGNVENSILSTKYAIKLGVDLIEADVQVTKDGIPVLNHDRTIERMTGIKGKVSDFTLEELRRFRLKSWLGLPTEERIPTLESILKIARGKILIDLDLKTKNVAPIVEVIKKTRMQGQVLYFSNDYKLLAEIKSLDKDAIFMPRAYSLEMANRALEQFDTKIIHIDPSFYTKEVANEIISKHARVWINSLGEKDCKMRYSNIEKNLKELTQFGASVIQTDEPAMLLEYLRAKGLHR